MLVVHVADLHLGKTLHERDLLPDQAYMLEGLLALLRDRRPAALLLAGDLFDRSIPSPEALSLFNSFLERAVAGDPSLVIVAIPGNHDSAARLSFGAGLLARAGVHLRTRASECDQPIRVERDGESLDIWALPFLTPGSFGAEPSGGATGPRGDPESPAPAAEEQSPVLRSQAELFAEGIARITARMSRRSANLLLAHCFAAGGTASASERVFVGSAEQVDARLMDSFDYAALGHLHRHQFVGSRACYAGSPLAYSFSEVDTPRGFLVVETGQGRFKTDLVPFAPLHPMHRVEGSFAELSQIGARPDLREAYVEIRLTDPLPVVNPADALKGNFPYLLSVRQAAFELTHDGSGSELPDRGSAGSAAADFLLFNAEMRGTEPDEISTALFMELLAEAEREAT